MPLAPNALTTLEAVKSYLKIPFESTTDDQNLEDLINSCSAAIESYCGRKFKVQIITDEEYDGNGRKHILLEQYPVKTIESVKIDDTILDSSSYKVKKKNGMLIHHHKWPEGDINIAVTYVAGFDEIPADLELACRHFVMSFFKADVANFSTTFSEGFVFRPEALPSQVKALIAPYKKVV